jgi:hypothetical protein
MRDSHKKNKKNTKKPNRKNKNKQFYVKENDSINEKFTEEDKREYSDQSSGNIIYDENIKIGNNEGMFKILNFLPRDIQLL